MISNPLVTLSSLPDHLGAGKCSPLAWVPDVLEANGNSAELPVVLGRWDSSVHPEEE